MWFVKLSIQNFKQKQLLKPQTRCEVLGHLHHIRTKREVMFRCRYKMKISENFNMQNVSVPRIVVLEPLGDIEICTYIRVRTLVCPRTGKGDKFMTPFVYHETANCKKREASWCYRQSWYTCTAKKKNCHSSSISHPC